VIGPSKEPDHSRSSSMLVPRNTEEELDTLIARFTSYICHSPPIVATGNVNIPTVASAAPRSTSWHSVLLQAHPLAQPYTSRHILSTATHLFRDGGYTPGLEMNSGQCSLGVWERRVGGLVK